MSHFENVSITKAANTYFEGKVTSRTITLASGEKKTLGVMLPGEYTFNTQAPEIMEVTAGKVNIKIAGEEAFTLYEQGSSFNVPANSSFDLEVLELFDYVCTYLG